MPIQISFLLLVIAFLLLLTGRNLEHTYFGLRAVRDKLEGRKRKPRKSKSKDGEK